MFPYFWGFEFFESILSSSFFYSGDFGCLISIFFAFVFNEIIRFDFFSGKEYFQIWK